MGFFAFDESHSGCFSGLLLVKVRNLEKPECTAVISKCEVPKVVGSVNS
jgi:hypothetical protein